MTLKPGEAISGHDAKDRILKNQSTTNFDYYPMLVSWINGFWTLLNIPKEDLPKELLPIQINMAILSAGRARRFFEREKEEVEVRGRKSENRGWRMEG